MDAIDAIISRTSSPKLKGPAPSADELEIILRAASRAPDHGMLKPWRFIVAKEERLNDLGDFWANAIFESTEDEELADSMRSKPLRAPMVIIAYMDFQPSPKAPRVEQILATGAAVQNMMIAIHAMGYAAYWRTGNFARNEELKHRMNLKEEDEIVGFIYIGTADCQPKQLKPVDIHDYVTFY
ncbi:MAG: nitroreductase [Pseudomonadota bacterium]